MLSNWTLGAFIITLMLHGSRSQAVAQCSNPISRKMEFSVTSHKDRTGHWVAEVEMEHDDNDIETDMWRVDVKHSTTGCAGSPKVKVTAKLTAPPLKPPPGYELHQGVGYYKLHTNKKTWHEAKATCESEGTHLAILNSEAESDVLKQMFAQVPQDLGTWALVGFHDIYTEGQFLTIYDEPLSSTGFTRWVGPGQPDNAGGSATNPGEDCGSFNRGNGGLNDLNCNSKVIFFCEQEIDSSTHT